MTPGVEDGFAETVPKFTTVLFLAISWANSWFSCCGTLCFSDWRHEMYWSHIISTTMDSIYALIYVQSVCKTISAAASITIDGLWSSGRCNDSVLCWTAYVVAAKKKLFPWCFLLTFFWTLSHPRDKPPCESKKNVWHINGLMFLLINIFKYYTWQQRIG